MIVDAVSYIKEELKNFIELDLESPVNIDIDNIALFETDHSSTLENQIIITLVNIEEESTLKNIRNINYNPDGGFRYTTQPVFLNLYLLFSCNFKVYSTALTRLEQILQFFQQRRKFDIKSTTSTANQDAFLEDEQEFKLLPELYSLTFEQINHLWGALGGRQVPSVMFKIRLVKIDDTQIFKQGPPVEEIQGKLELTNEC